MARLGVPVTTLRLPLEQRLTLDDAAAIVDDAAALGATHLYLSPILQATPGSSHGYDVVDHSRVASDLGGEPAWARLLAASRRAGLGVVLDIVPNHMAVPTPENLNAQLWSVLKEGRASRHAKWFDIDWDAGAGRLVLPLLGARLDEVLAAGELTTDRVGAEEVIRYHDHVFPLARGTSGMPLGSLLEAQHYRLASWRDVADLDYRRFFDVTSLIAVRVEDEQVFDATHERILELVRSGAVEGLRVDHPDGLADPAAYLARLAEATSAAPTSPSLTPRSVTITSSGPAVHSPGSGGVWVVLEKILEGEEHLPKDWACAGTTGYDALLRVGGLFVDPDGAADLTRLSEESLGEHQELAVMLPEAKLQIIAEVLTPEVDRLLRLVGRALPHLDLTEARRALVALLAGLDRYRIYVRPGEPAAPEAVAAMADLVRRVVEDDPSLDRSVVVALVDLALHHPVGTDDEARRDFCTRFQQTSGPVMAKAVEDTTWYRYVRLVGLNEVGGDPGRFGISVAQFHAFAARLAREWPATMTTLTTHDTKRSEDVRARLAVLSERPLAWAEWLHEARRLTLARRPQRLDRLTEHLVWQTLVGAWPIDEERLAAYCHKAIREAKLHTSWTDPDEAYEHAVQDFARLVATDRAVTTHVEAWLRATAHETRTNILGQKLVQLTMPGVPDVYQGTDLVDLSLVDPDNRRPVDWAERRTRLARLEAGEPPQDLSDEKLLVTTAALRLRRECPEAFVGGEGDYTPLESGSDHVVAFARGSAGAPDVVVLATRLAGHLVDAGGWGAATITLPEGRWHDALRDRLVDGGAVPLEVVLPVTGLPVALLVRGGPGFGPGTG
jgi:(1->4)-alpha-D-glucan 1-alpha-D-glucosylmutase